MGFPAGLIKAAFVGPLLWPLAPADAGAQEVRPRRPAPSLRGKGSQSALARRSPQVRTRRTATPTTGAARSSASWAGRPETGIGIGAGNRRRSPSLPMKSKARGLPIIKVAGGRAE
jgi:hypothetical protein